MDTPSLAILHYASPPIIGGVEYTMGAHARLLCDRGYRVKIVAGRGAQFDPRVPLHMVPGIDSKDPSVLKVNEQLAQGVVTNDFHSLTASIANALRDALADVDICIGHNVLTLHKNLALTSALHEIAESGRIRLIAWCHDFSWDDPLYMGEMHQGFPWELLRTRWLAVKYVVVSEARRAELARLLGMPATDIAVVPPGVDPISFLGIGETAARWVSELGLLEAQPLLLLPARVTRRKNIELGIEITAALRSHGLDPKLVTMGPLGPHNPANASYLEELRALSRERGVEDAVIFLSDLSPLPLPPPRMRGGDERTLESGGLCPPLSRPHFPSPRWGEGQGEGESSESSGADGGANVDDAARRDLYLLADALLFTSEREGFGIPVLEAGLARLPVFCSDILPFRESAGQWAHYFALDQPPGDIARMIAECLDSDDRYRLKQRVIREYSWPRIMAENIEPLLMEG